MIFGTTGTGSPGVTNPTGTSPISTVNPLNYYFASPITSGYGSNVSLQAQNSIALSTAGGAGGTLVTGKGTFGVTDYKAPTAVQQATIQVNNGIRATTAATAASSSATSNPGFTTMGSKRAAAYYTTVSPRMVLPAAAAGGLQTQLQTMLAQSSALPTAQNLGVSMDGQQTIVLRGTVGTEDERTMAEGLARLTPGVRAVDNQITVRPK
jgi:osmotically-inducible protein OsmY